MSKTERQETVETLSALLKRKSFWLLSLGMSAVGIALLLGGIL